MKQQRKFLFIIMTLIIACTPTYGANTGTEPVEEVPEFKDYMMDHPFEGCPGGSKCLKITGEKRKIWTNLLKGKKNRLKQLESQRQKVGVPLALWTYEVNPFPENLVKWNSPCEQHNKAEQKIFTAEILSRDFKTLTQQKHLIIRKSLVQESQDRFTEYPTLRDESPLYISNKKLVYMLDLEGEYYGVAIARDGAVTMLEPIKPERFPENIKCSEEMQKAFETLQSPANLYKGISCRAIWDQDQKRFFTLIAGWSCS